MEKNRKGTFIFELKPPYKILECDAPFLNLLEYSPKDLQKRVHLLRDIIAEDDYEDLVASLRYQLKCSNYTSDKACMLNVSGQLRKIILNGQVFTLKDGRDVLKCSCVDVSTLETATLTTEQALSDLEVFSQSVRCGLSKHVCDNSLSLIWANDYFYTLFGYTREEYQEKYGNILISMIYKEDLPLVVNSITSLLEDHEVDINFRICHKLKKFRWVNLVAASVEGDNPGEFPIANFVMKDITELKYAEMRAQLEEKKYEIIADISEEIPFEYEITKDTITYAKKYETMFGRKSIYKHPEQYFVEHGYVSEDTKDVFCGIFEAARNGESIHSEEYKLRNANGDYEWYYSTFSLIMDENGEPYRAVGIIRNINLQKKEQESLLVKSQTDAMTGLLNKATTEAYIKEQLKNIQSGAKDVLMVVDIDDFKNVNDTYGHLTGDEVIIAIANILMRFSFQDGIVGRIGGDEFVVYLKNVLDNTFACEKAEKVAKELKEKYPGGNGKPKITLSIGIAATEVAMPYSDLLEQADAAVYQAKLNGKNGYVLYDEALERKVYHNERKNNMCDYDSVVISNVIYMLSESTDIKNGISQAVQYMGSSLGLDRIVLWEYAKDSNFLCRMLEWHAEQVSYSDVAGEKMKAVICEEIDTLTITGIYHSVNPSAIKLSEFSKSPFCNVNEFLQGRFQYQKETIAYIGVMNYSEEKMWTTQQIETLDLFIKILNSYMQQHYLNIKDKKL